MQKIRESHKEVCKKTKIAFETPIVIRGLQYYPKSLDNKTLNSHFHTNTFEKTNSKLFKYLF